LESWIGFAGKQPVRKTKKPAGMRKRKPETIKRRDRFAAALEDARFRARVVKSAKLYRRKPKAPPVEEDES
jgi:hypothetical protein